MGRGARVRSDDRKFAKLADMFEARILRLLRQAPTAQRDKRLDDLVSTWERLVHPLLGTS